MCHGLRGVVDCFSTWILIIFIIMLVLFYNVDVVIINYHSRVHLKLHSDIRHV